MRITHLAGYPVEQYDSPNRGGAVSGHKGPVLHIAEGTYRGTIAWQLNPDQRYADGTSVNSCSTWIIGKTAGEIAQMVDTDLIAWSQRGGSRDRSSVELAGYHSDATLPTAWQVEACAHLLLWEHQHYAVPVQVANNDLERGLGHHSMDREWAGVEWGHEDCPGQYVIAAKPRIVARAVALAGGEDDVLTPTDINALVKAIASDANFQYLLWRVDAIAHLRVPAGGPEQGMTLPLVAAVKTLREDVDDLQARPGTAQLSDVQADAIARQLIDAVGHPLTQAYLDVVTAAVKVALREGTGG